MASPRQKLDAIYCHPAEREGKRAGVRRVGIQPPETQPEESAPAQEFAHAADAHAADADAADVAACDSSVPGTQRSCWNTSDATDASPGVVCAGGNAVAYVATHVAKPGIYEACSAGPGQAAHRFWLALRDEQGALCSIRITLRDVHRLLGQMARGKRLEDLLPAVEDHCCGDREPDSPCKPVWRLPEDLSDDLCWPLPEPDMPAEAAFALPPAPAVAGSVAAGRYAPAVADAIDKLLEIRSQPDAGPDAVASIDRALHALTQPLAD